MTGVPSIPALVFFIPSMSIGGVMTFQFFRLGNIDTPSILVGVFIIGYFTFVTFLLITRFRILKFTNDKIDITYLFLFKKRQIKIDEVSNLNWRLRGTIKFGDFKELQIETKDGKIEKLTDFEFGNLEKLENYLISKLKFQPNLIKKRETEIYQAKGNKLIAVFFLLFCLTIIMVTVIEIKTTGDIHLPQMIILGVFGLLTIRLTSRLLKYRETLKDYEKARKKRTKLD